MDFMDRIQSHMVIDPVTGEKVSDQIGNLSNNKAEKSDLDKTNKKVTANHTGTNDISNYILSAMDYEALNQGISLPFTDNPTPVTVMTSGVPSIPFFPALTVVNGKLFTAIRVASDHASTLNGKIVTRTSTDGVTWSYLGQPVDNGRDARDVGLIVATNGNLIMRFFDRSSANDYLVKVMISTDYGVTWGNEILLPKPNDYTGGIAARGDMTIKDGVIYCVCYTTTGYAYVVKSTDNGATWSFVSYISKDWLLNETSICYNSNNSKFYFVGRQQVYKTGVTPFTDYHNFLVIGESADAITWDNIHEIPLYGHAPSLLSLSSDKMLLTYKNTNTDNSTSNFQLNSVVLKNGNIFSQVMNLANSPSFDAFYSDVAILNSKLFFVYHDLNANAIKSLSLAFSDVDKLTPLSHVHSASNYANTSDGYWSVANPFSFIWQEDDMSAMTLNAGAVYNRRITLSKSFTTRPYSVTSYLYRPGGDLTDIDNIMVYARMVDSSTVSVTFRNVGATNINIDTGYKLKTCAFGS